MCSTNVKKHKPMLLLAHRVADLVRSIGQLELPALNFTVSKKYSGYNCVPLYAVTYRRPGAIVETRACSADKSDLVACPPPGCTTGDETPVSVA